MKKFLILLFTTMAALACARDKNARQQTVFGSWINNNIYEYYEHALDQNCIDRFYDHQDFVPLYLSFKNNDQLEITSKYEQGVKIYSIESFKDNILTAYDGKNRLKIILIDSKTLEFSCNNKKVIFRKISEGYSDNVFGEFIKNKIFKDYTNYSLHYSTGATS